jgi:AP2 domain/HNH endonuclease
MSEGIRIPLNHRKHALIDAEDAPLITPYRWYASYDGERWIAARGERLGHGVGAPVRTIYLHRVLIDAPPEMGVTHLNGDTLDNRNANLRLCTRSERGAKRRRNLNNTSGYRGVSYDAHSGLWRAVVRSHGLYVSAGYFKTPEEAARAYDTTASELFGEFAYRNLPLDTSVPRGSNPAPPDSN